jgi:hypothetical protein
MEQEEAFGRLGRDVEPVLPELGRQPERLAWQLLGIDVLIAPSRVHHHEPDQPGSHDEPDDEQPPVELGVHRREV